MGISRREVLVLGAYLAMNSGRRCVADDDRAALFKTLGLKKDFRPCVDVGSAPEQAFSEAALDSIQAPSGAGAAAAARNRAARSAAPGATPTAKAASFQAALSSAPRQTGRAATGPARMAFYRKWVPGQQIPIGFAGGSSNDQSLVRDVVQQWAAAANIKFNFVGAVPNLANQTSPIVTISFRQGGGNWSYLGQQGISEARQNGEASSLNLDLYARNELRRNTGLILHEFGHMLGAVHEHQSPAIKDATCALITAAEVIRWFLLNTDFTTANQVIDNVLTPYAVSELIRFSQFDKDSIMCYYLPDELFTCGKGTPENTELSLLDKKFARELYPFVGDLPPGSEPPTLVTTRSFAKPITVGGGFAKGAILEPRAVVSHALSVTETGIFDVKTRGATQVKLRALDSAGNPIALEDLPFKNYFNERIRVQLNAGQQYTIEVRHASNHAIGEFETRVDKF